jgi:hypothetical protein
MAQVFTAASSFGCGHGGIIAIKDDPQTKLTVAGLKVLTVASLSGQLLSSPCQIVPTSPPAPISTPCLSCTGVSATLAVKLTVHGTSVLLAPIVGTTDGELAGLKPLPPSVIATNIQAIFTAV